MRPEIIFDDILRNKVSRITASPYFIKRLAEFCISENKNTHTVKKIFTGGAPVFPSEAKIFVKAFPKTLVEIVYGSTEAEPISHIFANELVKEKIEKALPVGKIYFNAEVKIIKISDLPLTANNTNDFQELVLPAGRVGEIIVSGDHVLKKYFDNEEAFRQNKIVCGSKTWHRTGDSGFIGEDGNLFLTGRSATLFEHKGKTVFPFIAEDLLKQIEGVQAGTVMKVKNEVIYFIETSNGNESKNIEDAIKTLGIADGKVVFTKIPRDLRHFSKIDYGMLLKQYNKI
ncbi:MAG: AMP-binding protein [Bacteroidia bacterium]|nr:AMP-binding protein [Bacteroidia bacterium]